MRGTVVLLVLFCLSGAWTQEERGGCSVCLGHGLRRREEGVLSVWGMDSGGERRVFCLSGTWTQEERGGCSVCLGHGGERRGPRE
jgi:hypothetical protein